MQTALKALCAVVCLTFAPNAHAADKKNFVAQKNKCLDVAGGAFTNGAKPQLWDCDGANANQQWALVDGTLQTNSNKCLDVTDGKWVNGGQVQLWDCDATNKNQGWEMVGASLRHKNTNLCLDVKDGQFKNGGQLQIWTCDFRGTGNQIWAFGAAAPTAPKPAPTQPAAAASPADATSFYGYPAVSIDAFMAKNPLCAWIKDAVVAAAKDQGLNATFLATTCIVESSCSVPKNGWGPFQFSDDGAWRAYGGANKDRQNVWDAAYGAARYFKALLAQTNNNLDEALRLYNGPISQGGNPKYQQEYRTWMSGQNAWELGI